MGGGAEEADEVVELMRGDAGAAEVAELVEEGARKAEVAEFILHTWSSKSDELFSSASSQKLMSLTLLSMNDLNLFVFNFLLMIRLTHAFELEKRHLVL